jgi:hypothetical protein
LISEGNNALHFADTHHLVENGVLVERICDQTNEIISYLNDSLYRYNYDLSQPSSVLFLQYNAVTGDPYFNVAFDSSLASFVCDYV